MVKTTLPFLSSTLNDTGAQFLVQDYSQLLMILDDLWSRFHTFDIEKRISAWPSIDANTAATMSTHVSVALGRPLHIKLGGWIFY